MKTTKHKPQGVAPVGSSAVLGVIRQNQNQKGNGLAVAADDSNYLPVGNANHIACEDVLEHGVRPVLSLLGMMQCPDCRIQILDKTNPDRDLLLAIESLWLSVGHPRSELWRRLLLYFRDSDMVCSYNQTLTPNDPKLSHADGRVAPQAR